MATIIEVKKLALDLTEKERAVLTANLLESLPGALSDEDEGVAEALRRDWILCQITQCPCDTVPARGHIRTRSAVAPRPARQLQHLHITGPRLHFDARLRACV